jgi:CBS domain-containing protein
MKVEDVMTRDVKWCRIDDTLNSAARIMWENDCGCVPIVDEDGRVAGIVTDRDICMATYTQGMPLYALPIQLAMSREPIACSPAASLETAHRLMRTHEIHRILVAEPDGRLAGILSVSDIANATNGAESGGQSQSHAMAVAETISTIRKHRVPKAAHPGIKKKAPVRKKASAK